MTDNNRDQALRPAAEAADMPDWILLAADQLVKTMVHAVKYQSHYPYREELDGFSAVIRRHWNNANRPKPAASAGAAGGETESQAFYRGARAMQDICAQIAKDQGEDNRNTQWELAADQIYDNIITVDVLKPAALASGNGCGEGQMREALEPLVEIITQWDFVDNVVFSVSLRWQQWFSIRKAYREALAAPSEAGGDT